MTTRSVAKRTQPFTSEASLLEKGQKKRHEKYRWDIFRIVWDLVTVSGAMSEAKS